VLITTFCITLTSDVHEILAKVHAALLREERRLWTCANDDGFRTDGAAFSLMMLNDADGRCVHVERVRGDEQDAGLRGQS